MVANLIEEIKNFRLMSIQLESEYVGRIKSKIYRTKAAYILSKTKSLLIKLSVAGMSTITRYHIKVDYCGTYCFYEILYDSSFSKADIRWLLHLTVEGEIIEIIEKEKWITGSLVKIG